MKRNRAVIKGRSILAMDTLGEVRRAMRILRRVEKYLVQQARREKAGHSFVARLQQIERTAPKFDPSEQP